MMGLLSESRSLPTVPNRPKVAVIGSGLAGLTTSHLLAISGCDVTLYEREANLGMDGSSITVECQHRDGETHAIRVDTPMRSFSGGFYRHLLKLYRHLGVPIETRAYSYTFQSLTDKRPHTIYDGNGGRSGIETRLSKPLIIFGFLYYTVLALFLTYSGLTRSRILRHVSHDTFCQIFMIPGSFRRDLLDPMFQGVTTCTKTDLDVYPAAYILEYRAKTFLRPHYSTNVSKVVAILTENIHSIELCAETSIDFDKRVVKVKDKEPRSFDNIVLAYPQSDVPITKTSVINHKNIFVLPKDYIRELNFECHPDHTRTTHVLCSAALFQTTLPTQYTTDFRQYVSKSNFSRARAIATDNFLHKYLDDDYRKLSNFNGHNGVYYVGSYVYYGIPLLEGCVSSAYLVACDILNHHGLSKAGLHSIFA